MRTAIITALLVLLLIPVSPVMAGDAAANLNYDVNVKVNGAQTAFTDQNPFINTSTGRTYVPLRFVTEKLGAEVGWNQEEKAAVIKKDGNIIKAPVGSNSPTVNGDKVSLDAPVKLMNSRTLVPLRFMSEAVGARVNWNGNTKTVSIDTVDTGDEPAGDKDDQINIIIEEEELNAVVTAGILNVRGGPGSSNPVTGQVRQGDELPIQDSELGWHKVELPGGESGWVAGWYVEVRGTGSEQDISGSVQGVVDAANVNVRSGPGKTHDIIASVDLGESLNILEKAGSWYKVKLLPGTIGWIANWLVRVESADAAVPDRGSRDSSLAGLDVQEVDGRTLAVINTTGPAVHDIFTLSDPARVVVDLKGVEPGDKSYSEIDVNNNLVKKIRTSKYSENPDITRLVFDVKKPVIFDTAVRDKNGGEELTLELYVPELGDQLEGKVIALDPGHGGYDNGATGCTGLKEKEVNLDVALLAAHLLRQNGAEVILTRNSDKFVGLKERTQIAQKAGADIFISIHMNANPSSSTSGTSTYYRRDNISGLGVSQQDNRALAQQVQSQLLLLLNRQNVGIKQANFVVLRTAAMPSILVEGSFLSNPAEENLMKTDSYRAKIAEAAARGAANYFKLQ
ncbi:MAG: N-acetylmuramoyl-L-alanine amidase [Clostridiales bacterium]|nr:N-acetylmuramoyl-L-alanine amidase [Clostridiales bacterium]MCF8023187.1 N-acetylmuramoyl-L-alanine amidase [Clostridiales bacterium]